MMIEIHKPELEALIEEQLESGHFQSIEELLWQKLSPSPAAQQPKPRKPRQNLADFLLNSPFAGSELDLELPQEYMPDSNL